MTGVSLRLREREFLALPGGLPALRAGRTVGLPLLAPWANRLAGRQFVVDRRPVDLRGVDLLEDQHGLPMHGLLLGRPGWRIESRGRRGVTATLSASIDV